MFLPSKYDSVYPFSYLFTYFVTVPHALLTQLAFPIGNAQQGMVWFPHPACTRTVISYANLLLTYQAVC